MGDLPSSLYVSYSPYGWVGAKAASSSQNLRPWKETETSNH